MRRVQVIPDGEFRLYGAMVGKEVELAQKNRGTFHRSGANAPGTMLPIDLVPQRYRRQTFQ